MELISSPWEDVFLDFVRSINRRATFVSPYIAAQPLTQLTSNVNHLDSVQINIVTKIDATSMLHKSLDVEAIETFCRKFTETKVKHIPGLHAKVYIADNHTAIVTSGNLTSSSLSRNLEYGIRVNDRDQVSEISRNIYEYEKLGMQLSIQQLNKFSEISSQLAEKNDLVSNSVCLELRETLEQHLHDAQYSIDELRGTSGKSITSIFGKGILYVLRNGPLPTEAIYSQIQRLFPDLCDDSEERIINGVHFGKKWKHHVRNAQQYLKRKNQIEKTASETGNEWKLTGNSNN